MYRIGQEEINAVANAINEKSLFKVNDKLQYAKKAEEKMCSLMGAKYGILMTSGHAALEAALVAAGIGPGDEVIVPAYTYIATAMAVVAAGAIPVICDINDTLTLDPAAFEAKITKNTKAVMPVHIQGFPCKMDEICDIAKKHNIVVIEDACQADGAKYKGKRLGTWGDAGAYSFNFFKIITAGEGGGLVTDNREIFENSLIYHDSSAIAYFGKQMEDFKATSFCGKEYRTNDISAAILDAQFDRLDGIIADLKKNQMALREKLAPYCTFAPSNDIEGDLGTTIAIAFETEEAARKFATYEGVKCGLPIDTGKHVYTNWSCIMEKRGALNPLMDPFKFEANKDIVPNYTHDMCKKSLDILSRNVYVAINPDWTKQELEERANALIAGLKA